jgi:hypothetical protein
MPLTGTFWALSARKAQADHRVGLAAGQFLVDEKDQVNAARRDEGV